MGLLDAFKQYVSDALPGGLLNPETKPIANRARYASGLLDPNSAISNDLQGWHKRTQDGLADQLAGKQTPAAEQAYQTMMQMVGVAPVGMMTMGHGTPWHLQRFNEAKTKPLTGLQKIQPAGAETSVFNHPRAMMEGNQSLQDAWLRVMNEPLPNSFGNPHLEALIDEQRKALPRQARYVVDK